MEPRFYTRIFHSQCCNLYIK